MRSFSAAPRELIPSRRPGDRRWLLSQAPPKRDMYYPLVHMPRYTLGELEQVRAQHRGPQALGLDSRDQDRGLRSTGQAQDEYAIFHGACSGIDQS